MQRHCKFGNAVLQCEQYGPLMSGAQVDTPSMRVLRRVRVGEASNPGPPKGQHSKRHRSRNVARDSQCVVSSDDEPFAARSVAITDLDATMTTVLTSTTPTSSQTLARAHQRRMGTMRIHCASDSNGFWRATMSARGPGGGCSATMTAPGASGDSLRSGPDRSDCGEDGDEIQFAHHGVENHRRGFGGGSGAQRG